MKAVDAARAPGQRALYTNSVEEDQARLMRAAIEDALKQSFATFQGHPSASNWTMLQGAMLAHQQTHEVTGVVPEELLVAWWRAAKCNVWAFARTLDREIPLL